jgi:pSer/pThr/pTyr-binding forkhead associated (FHA) protein/outer membrane biosynthesis protein TonB
VSKPVVLKIFRNGGVVDIKQFVDQPQIVIGASDADVQVKLQGQVSPFHASIEKRGDKYVLSDLGSSQGTYLKGAKVLEAALEHGDKIAVGEYIIEFYVGAPGVAVVAPTTPVHAPTPAPKAPAPPAKNMDDEDTLVDRPVPRPISQVASRVTPMASAGGGVIAAAVPSNAKRKKGEKTFAPASTYKNLNEFVRPTKGSTVEVLVAWKERVIASYHFHEKGTITYGSHPSCDIVIPSLTSKVHKAPLLQIDGKATVFIPPGMAGSLVHDNQTTALTQLYSQGRLQAAAGGGSTISLAQGEMVRVGIGGDVELVVRYCSETPKPTFIPMIDFASNGFLAVLLAVILAIVVFLYVALNKAEEKVDEEEEYRTALIIENPPPPPPPVKIEKVEVPPPVEKEVPKPPPEKKIVKVEPKKEPIPQKMEVKKEPTRTPVKQEPKKPAASAAKGGDSKEAKSMKANPNKPKSNQQGSVKQGGSVKNAAKDGAQAESTTKDPSKSGIFGVFGTGGKQAKLDNTYSGGGELAGMADAATGKAGFGEDRAGEGLGSKFKETGGGNGKSNVGVQGMGNGTGKGLGSGGFTGVGLGGKGTVSIVPGGGGETYGGNIDRNGIRQVFINNQRALASCYERALSVDKGLGGKIMLDFDIGEQGRVVRADFSREKSTLVNESLANCVISRMKTWRFPEPPNKNETVQVFYPLAFSNN